MYYYPDLKRFILYENRYSNIEDVFHKVVNQRKHTTQIQETNHSKETRKQPTLIHTSQTNTYRASSAIHSSSRVLRVRDQNNQTSFTNTPPTSASHLTDDRLDKSKTNETHRRGMIPIPPTINPYPTPSVCSRSTATTAKRTKPLIRNTPTDLFLFYQKDWERFRNLLPGENSRSSVRAEVHKRMAHQPPPNPKVYVRFGEGQKKTMTTRLGHREM